MGARVGGAARLDLACPDSKEMTLVREHAPQLPSHCRVVPPVPPPSPNPSTVPFGFEGGEIFSTDEPTVMEQRQQNEQIRGQVRQFAVAPFILLPTGLDAGVVRGDLLLPASEMGRQGVLLLCLGLDCLLDQQDIPIPTEQKTPLPPHFAGWQEQ